MYSVTRTDETIRSLTSTLQSLTFHFPAALLWRRSNWNFYSVWKGTIPKFCKNIIDIDEQEIELENDEEKSDSLWRIFKINSQPPRHLRHKFEIFRNNSSDDEVHFVFWLQHDILIRKQYANFQSWTRFIELRLNRVN